MSRSPIQPKPQLWVEQLAIIAESLISSGHSYDLVMGYDVVQVTAMYELGVKRSKRENLQTFALYRVAGSNDKDAVKDLINNLT